jgi:hypothetical protein
LNHFHYINRKNGVRILGRILILMGLIVLAVPYIMDVETALSKVFLVGGVTMLIGLVLTSLFSGTIIDFEANKFKEYQSFLWIKFGDWQNIPKIENAELIHYTYQHRNVPNGISPTLSMEVTTYKCVLRLEGKEFRVFDYQKEQDAIAALEILQNGFKLF